MHRPAKLAAMIDDAAAMAESPATTLPRTKPVRRPMRRMMLAAGYVHRPSPTTLSATGRVARAGSGASTNPDKPADEDDHRYRRAIEHGGDAEDREVDSR